MHRRWQPIVILAAVLGVALLLGGCGVEWPRPTHREPPIPTIGPVVNYGGGGAKLAITFSASTNCAEPGEIVTFTLQITNTGTYPLTITEMPLLDIELHSTVKGNPNPIPVQRWSASNQYPADINPLLRPAEIRHYEWHWVAEPRYVPTDPWDLGGVEARLSRGKIRDAGGAGSSAARGGAPLYVGVGKRYRPGPGGGNGWFECREMPRDATTNPMSKAGSRVPS